MTVYGKRAAELRAQQVAEWTIRMRVTRHWGRMKSISPVMRRALAEREIAAAMVAAGLPLPVRISFEEQVARHLHLARRDRSSVRSIRDLDIRRAVLAALDAEVAP